MRRFPCDYCSSNILETNVSTFVCVRANVAGREIVSNRQVVVFFVSRQRQESHYEISMQFRCNAADIFVTFEDSTKPTGQRAAR